jgi:hypothetical protein
MKFKLTIAIVIIILLIGGGIFETIYIQKTLGEFNEKLEQIADQETYDVETIKELQSWWGKKIVILSLTIPHFQLNEINFTLSELIGAVEAEDIQSSNALLRRIQEYSVTIMDTYKFSLVNIL